MFRFLVILFFLNIYKMFEMFRWLDAQIGSVLLRLERKLKRNLMPNNIYRRWSLYIESNQKWILQPNSGGGSTNVPQFCDITTRPRFIKKNPKCPDRLTRFPDRHFQVHQQLLEKIKQKSKEKKRQKREIILIKREWWNKYFLLTTTRPRL
jgi:hypothetical protein